LNPDIRDNPAITPSWRDLAVNRIHQSLLGRMKKKGTCDQRLKENPTGRKPFGPKCFPKTSNQKVLAEIKELWILANQ